MGVEGEFLTEFRGVVLGLAGMAGMAWHGMACLEYFGAARFYSFLSYFFFALAARWLLCLGSRHFVSILPKVLG